MPLPVTYKRAAALWLLFVYALSVLTPASIALIPASALAQGCQDGNCSPGGALNDIGLGGSGGGSGGGGLGGGLLGGLGGILGKLFQNPMFLVLLVTMLMQMFQGGGAGGGATPQRGTAEEQPSRPPSGAERFHSGVQPGVTGSAPPAALNTPNPFAGASTFAAGGRLFPATLSVKPGEGVTVYNTEQDTRAISVRRQGQSATLAQQKLAAGQSHLFRFSTAGSYEVCVQRETLASPAPTPVPSCSLLITVAP